MLDLSGDWSVMGGDGQPPGVEPACNSNAAPHIIAVNDQGESHDDPGWHYFELYGTFPTNKLCPSGSAADQRVQVDGWEKQDIPGEGDWGSCYATEVYCGPDVQWGSQPVRLPTSLTESKLTYYSCSQINLAFRQPPANSKCLFIVKRSQFAFANGPVSIRASEFGPIALPPPVLEIGGVNDRGDDRDPNHPAYHHFELYGRFPYKLNFNLQPDFEVYVDCHDYDRSPVVTGVKYGADNGLSYDQVNIAFWDPIGAPSASCTFRLRRSRDHAETPVWQQRINGPAPALHPKIGAYYWGAAQSDVNEQSELAKYGVQRIREAGIHGAIRFVVAPGERLKNLYNIDYSQCTPSWAKPDITFLPCALGLESFQKAFDEIPPDVPIVLTALDSAALGSYQEERHHTDLNWIQNKANYAAVRQEYYDAAIKLFKTRTGKTNGKTFIIANWEADNLLYCGRAYEFLTGTAQCYADSDEARKAALALTTWFWARQDGISSAQGWAVQNGIFDVHVLHGIEFAFHRFIQEEHPGWPDVLHDILPIVKPDAALYSAWESTRADLTDANGGQRRLDNELAEISAFLDSVGVKVKILGEFGRGGESALNQFTARDPWLLYELVKAGVRSPFHHIIMWYAFEGQDKQDALFSAQGDEGNAMRALRQASIDREYIESRESPDFVVHDVIDKGSINGRRYFFAYLTLQGALPDVAVAVDALWEWDVRYEGATWGLYAFSIPDGPERYHPFHHDRWCSFLFRSKTNHLREFGPVRLKVR